MRFVAFASKQLKMAKFQFGPALVLLAISCKGQVPSGGTLVALVAANGGIAIAADTRTTVAQTYCDGRTKLFVPKSRKHTVVFETGEGIQLPQPTATQSLDICGYINSTPPILDINAFLVEEVDANPDIVLTQTELQRIAEHCLSKVAEYAHTFDGHALVSYLGKNMFQGVIVTYDVEHETGLVGSFIIGVDSTGAPSLGTVQWEELLKTDAMGRDLQYFGETQYVKQYVYTLGEKFLGPCKALLGKTVSETSLPDASSAALALITASEETTKIVPPPTGIGGPIDVAIITTTGVAIERH